MPRNFYAILRLGSHLAHSRFSIQYYYSIAEGFIITFKIINLLSNILIVVTFISCYSGVSCKESKVVEEAPTDTTSPTLTTFSGSNTNELTFSYTLNSSDFDMDGITTTVNIILNSGTINDEAGNTASLLAGAIDTSGVIASFSGIKLWPDSNYNSTLWRDDSCFLSAAIYNADQIACWEDKSGQENNFLQSTQVKWNLRWNFFFLAWIPCLQMESSK